VLGAGVGGLVSAKILQGAGATRILLLDEYNHVGGNHIDQHIGPYTFDIGTLIFQEDSPLMAHFPELLSLYHPITCSTSRITPDGKIRPYPFSFREEIVRAGPGEWVRTFGSIITSRLGSRTIENADDFARYWIGSRLLKQSGLGRYIERFHGVPARELDKVFAEKRMGWIAEGASIRKRAARLFGHRETWEGWQSFVRPREGFGKLYTAARSSLEAAGAHFALGEKLTRIEKVGPTFRIVTPVGEYSTERLISTIPLSTALKACGMEQGGELPMVELVSLFYSVGGERAFDSTVFYNFSDTGRWKRITVYSDYYGKANGRQYFGVEVNAGRPGAGSEAQDSAEALHADFIADIRLKGVFEEEPRLEGHHRLRHAYPVYLKGAAERAQQGIDTLKRLGIETLGRQGRFDYLPTARHVTQAVEKHFKTAFENGHGAG
jgi:protoporphyrinogen oxidase